MIIDDRDPSLGRIAGYMMLAIMASMLAYGVTQPIYRQALLHALFVFVKGYAILVAAGFVGLGLMVWRFRPRTNSR